MIFKKTIKKSKETIGTLGVGEHELDFIAGADIDVKRLGYLPNQDRVYMEVDQDYRPYTTACTMMSSYSVVLSLFNMKEKEEEKKAIIEEAKKQGYVPGRGRWTRLGVDVVRKVWNKLHPDKKVIYIRTEIGSDEFRELMKKGYGAVFTRKLDRKYLKDFWNDLCVDGYNFSGSRGHAIAGYRGEKCGNILHVNTYPKRGKKNRYEVKDIMKLVDNGFYAKNVYFYIKEEDWNKKDEILKRKIIGFTMFLNDRLRTLNINERTKEILDCYDNYFKSVGFKKWTGN